MANSSSLVPLAQRLLEHAKALGAYKEQHLDKGSQESYTNADELFANAPPHVEEARKAVIDISQDIKRLAQGPRDLILENLNKVSNIKQVLESGDFSRSTLTHLSIVPISVKC